jgi:hypothetical protein
VGLTLRTPVLIFLTDLKGFYWEVWCLLQKWHYFRMLGVALAIEMAAPQCIGDYNGKRGPDLL